MNWKRSLLPHCCEELELIVYMCRISEFHMKPLGPRPPLGGRLKMSNSTLWLFPAALRNMLPCVHVPNNGASLWLSHTHVSWTLLILTAIPLDPLLSQPLPHLPLVLFTNNLWVLCSNTSFWFSSGYTLSIFLGKSYRWDCGIPRFPSKLPSCFPKQLPYFIDLTIFYLSLDHSVFLLTCAISRLLVC